MTLDAGVKKLAEFIMKLKSKAIQETMGVDMGKVRGVKRMRNIVFPEHKTLEEALAAGLRCTKCVATKLSTKGCKACMGKRLEAIMRPMLIIPVLIAICFICILTMVITLITLIM